ncbi:MAG TPA: hypothetical protein VI248_17175 [Kineosporiaceae bacterium]
MAKNFRLSRRTIVAGVLAAATVTIGAIGLPFANAAPANPSTVSATGRTQSDAAAAAYKICESQGYNADRVQSSVTNADGSVTVTMLCYSV